MKSTSLAVLFVLAAIFTRSANADELQNQFQFLPKLKGARTADSIITSAQVTNSTARAALGMSGALLDETVPAPPPDWETNYAAAYKRALDEHKLLVVLYTVRWCKWCHDSLKELPEVEALAKLSKCAVLLAVDPEQSPAARAVGDALEIRNYPALSVLYPDPASIQEAVRITGYYPPASLSKQLRSVISPFSERLPDGIQLSEVGRCNL